jgi:hypothetical protein
MFCKKFFLILLLLMGGAMYCPGSSHVLILPFYNTGSLDY